MREKHMQLTHRFSLAWTFATQLFLDLHPHLLYELTSIDTQVELNLSFSEAAKGCIKQVSFTSQVLCSSCRE